VKRISDVLAESNPRFDPEKFKVACERGTYKKEQGEVKPRPFLKKEAKDV
jgi:hypothetical protein